MALSYGKMLPKLDVKDTDDRVTVLTVASVREQNMKGKRGRGDDENKLVISFAETFRPADGWQGTDDDARQREYVVTSTSYHTLCAKFGDDYTRWVGKRIPFEPRSTQFDGRTYYKLHVASPGTWDEVLAEFDASAPGAEPRTTRNRVAKKTRR